MKYNEKRYVDYVEFMKEPSVMSEEWRLSPPPQVSPCAEMMVSSYSRSVSPNSIR